MCTRMLLLVEARAAVVVAAVSAVLMFSPSPKDLLLVTARLFRDVTLFFSFQRWSLTAQSALEDDQQTD